MKIIDKLKKLIAHEESARAIGNTAEAEAFAATIQQLLDKHNLSMSEVELHAAQSSPVDCEPVQDKLEEIEDWHRVLLFNVARINGCHSLEHRYGYQIVVGRKSDREIVISLFNYFVKLALKLADDFMQAQEVTDEDSLSFPSFSYSYSFTGDQSRKSFLLGFATQVCLRLEEINRKDTKENNNSAALVFLGNRAKDNQDWVDKNLNVEESDVKIETDIIDRKAFMRGAYVGDSVALTDKVIG